MHQTSGKRKTFPQKFQVSKSLYIFLFKIHGQICRIIIKLHLISKFYRKLSSSWKEVLYSIKKTWRGKHVYTEFTVAAEFVNCVCTSCSCHNSCQQPSLRQGFHYAVDRSCHSDSAQGSVKWPCGHGQFKCLDTNAKSVSHVPPKCGKYKLKLPITSRFILSLIFVLILTQGYIYWF